MPEVRIVIPFLPASLKNNARVGNGRFYKDPKIEREQSVIRMLAAQAVRAMGHRVVTGPLWPTEEVAVDARRVVGRDELEVTFRMSGPKPKGKTGRDRDTQNLCESLLDAVAGIIYADDRQVAQLHIVRLAANQAETQKPNQKANDATGTFGC